MYIHKSTTSLCREGWTYHGAGTGLKGAGYYLGYGQAPSRYRVTVGRSVFDWRQAYAKMLPPQALLSGLYAGSYLKRTQRKDPMHSGYLSDAIECPFTLTILGPALGASYFRFQVNEHYHVTAPHAHRRASLHISRPLLLKQTNPTLTNHPALFVRLEESKPGAAQTDRASRLLAAGVPMQAGIVHLEPGPSICQDAAAPQRQGLRVGPDAQSVAARFQRLWSGRFNSRAAFAAR